MPLLNAVSSGPISHTGKSKAVFFSKPEGWEEPGGYPADIRRMDLQILAPAYQDKIIFEAFSFENLGKQFGS